MSSGCASMAVAWPAFVPSVWELPPNTPEAAYARLWAAGVRPMCARTIVDLLDPALD
jgi:hypothetical protein